MKKIEVLKINTNEKNDNKKFVIFLSDDCFHTTLYFTSLELEKLKADIISALEK